MKQENIKVEGVVTEDLSNRNFRVVLNNGKEIIAYLSGKVSKNKIRIIVGDTVVVEISPYDLNRGRITFRNNTPNS